MSNRLTALERAFQLARSGVPNSVQEIKKRLNSEGYLTAQIDGTALHKQLRALIRVSAGVMSGDATRGRVTPWSRAFNRTDLQFTPRLASRHLRPRSDHCRCRTTWAAT
jgi:hypothetical protein